MDDISHNPYKILSACIGTAMFGGVSAALFGTMAPVAGVVSGACFGLTFSQTGHAFSRLRTKSDEERSFKNLILLVATVAATLFASATLSFFACHAIGLHVTYDACVALPLVMGVVFSLLEPPVLFIIKIIRLAQDFFRMIEEGRQRRQLDPSAPLLSNDQLSSIHQSW